jgi:hypothetical protein
MLRLAQLKLVEKSTYFWLSGEVAAQKRKAGVVK